MNSLISDSGIVVGAGRTERAVALDLVRDFMDALGRRDFAVAKALLGPDFRMTVSGNHVFRTLEAFSEFSRGRNGAVRKHSATLEATESATGVAVYISGTMSGAWLDGSTFTDVRFIDRFLLVDGRIVDMQVWSDMAEFRPR